MAESAKAPTKIINALVPSDTRKHLRNPALSDNLTGFGRLARRKALDCLCVDAIATRVADERSVAVAVGI